MLFCKISEVEVVNDLQIWLKITIEYVLKDYNSYELLALRKSDAKVYTLITKTSFGLMSYD